MSLKVYKSSFGKIDSVARFEEQVSRGNEWVNWGFNNQFVSDLYDLTDVSPIHNACLRSKQINVVGRGFTNDYRINATQTLNDIFPYLVYEYLVTGNIFLETIFKKDKTQGLAGIHYIPSKYIRVGKDLNEMHLPENFWYSRDWTNYKKEKAIKFDAFDPSKDSTRQMTYIRQYNPQYLYYGAPDYLSVINDIRLNHEITIFNLASLKNGGYPGLWVHFSNQIPQTQREEIELLEKIEARYGGSENANNIILTFSDDPTTKPEITQLAKNLGDGFFSEIFELVQRQILSGHRIIDGSLIGLPAPTGFSNQAEQTREAYRIFMNTCINPIQSFLIRELTPIIQLLHPEEEVVLEIIDNQPVTN